jgi:Beta-lactamase enzyme family
MTRSVRRPVRILAAGALAAAAVLPGVAPAYPLDGYPETGIRRLEGSRLAQEGVVKDVKQPPGALLPMKDVDLRLAGQTFDLPAPDPALTRLVAATLTGGRDAYGFAVLDLTDPAKPRYAEQRGDHKQNVGSVGKLVVALALFQALADVYPDVEARRRLLKETVVTADAFSQSDVHTVRIFDPATRTLTRRPVQIGDRATLYEWLDWMLSPSSNSAAGIVMREAMLLRRYGAAYPPPEAEIRRFFDETPKPELAALFEQTFHEPVTRNGLDIDALRQASFFTAGGKRKVPDVGASYGTARELMRYLLRLEQGRIVDPWSSREIKRLIYVTERRIRYASSPALSEAAVYFKSGSLFECAPEPGFTCRPYAGNVKNYMNSAAIIEFPASGRKLYYMTTLTTNVLRKNSAAEHQALATQIQSLMAKLHDAQ